MNKKRDLLKIYWIVNLIMLFLFGMQFMGFPKKILMVWLGLVLVFEVIRCRKNVIDIPSVLLGLGGISYFYISGNGMVASVLFAVIPVFFRCEYQWKNCNPDINFGDFCWGAFRKIFQIFPFYGRMLQWKILV